MRKIIIGFLVITLITPPCFLNCHVFPKRRYVDSSSEYYMTAPEKKQNSHVYQGYSHNPFEASERLHHKTRTSNLTETDIPSSKSGKAHIASTVDQLELYSRNNNTVSSAGRSSKEGRLKRGVLQLYNMVSCATGCNPLSYKGYGCFCGFLGSGYPVDGIDRCCKMHDWCYDATNCHLFTEYVVPYYWKCFNNRPLCALDHGDLGASGSCAQRLCECDRVLSECLRRYPCPSSRALCKHSPLRLLQNTLFFF